ncbi:serine carboxypeptidase s28 domain-containing protein [Ditylenchus destructor]|nr:serine carboxypeptidase s28 domain-containing protein [Ditylenchus destructor]
MRLLILWVSFIHLSSSSEDILSLAWHPGVSPPTNDLSTQNDFGLIPSNFDALVDNFESNNNDTFKLRNSFGPCFLFIGSTRPITEYLKDYRFLFDMAKEMKATVVYVELRYFGESLPFGVDSDKSLSKLKFLTTKQILADCVRLIIHLKQQSIIPYDSPVTAYGTEIGGILATWLRVKHPNVVKGALASSAPVRMFANGGVPIGSYYMAVTESFRNAGCNVRLIQTAFDTLERLCDSYNGREKLNRIFNIQPNSILEDRSDYHYLKKVTFNSTTLNYPYDTKMSSSGNLPAHAIIKACTVFNASELTDDRDDGENSVRRLQKLVAVYYNYGLNVDVQACIKPEKCDVPDRSSNSAMASLYLDCKELQLASCAQGYPNDMFPMSCNSEQFWESATETKCGEIFGKMEDDSGQYTNLFAISDEYGFNFPQTTSNLIFTASSDPYSAGIIDRQVPEHKVFIIKIDNAGRSQELFQPNSCDPENVVNARFQIVQIIKCWSQLLDVNQCTADRLGWPLPAYLPKPAETVCRKIVASYPWGQSAPTQSLPLGAEANANFGINADVTVTASPVNSTEAYVNATEIPNSANLPLYNFFILANTLFLFWLNIPLQML